MEDSPPEIRARGSFLLRSSPALAPVSLCVYVDDRHSGDGTPRTFHNRDEY